MKTFEEIYQLREKYIDVSSCTSTIIRSDIVRKLKKLTGIENIDDKLRNIKPEENWEKLGCYINGLDAFLSLVYDPNAKCYLLIDDKKDPTGIIIFEIYADFISEIYLLGFKKNNVTLVRDVINLICKMKNKYKVIEWSVDNKNPVKKAYDKYISKLGGKSSEDRFYTQYLIKSSI
jgi:hypothetical protein